jgi:hypothetical protein
MIIILIFIVCAVLSYILYKHTEKKYLFGLECTFGCIWLVCILGICICIPWRVIAWSPSINDIEKSKVDAQREAIVSALNMEDRDLYVLAHDVGEFNAHVRSLKKMRENPMLKDYVWHFYDDIEEISLEEYKKEGRLNG